MAEQKQRESESVKRTGKRIWFYVIISVLITAAAMVYLGLSQPGIEEHIAAFEAARAVPDEENAAMIYAELLQDPEIPPDNLTAKIDLAAEAIMDPVSLREHRAMSRRLVGLELPEGLLDPNAEAITRLHSWRTADYPELKQWLDKHQNRIDKLQEAAGRPSCYFPLQSTPGRTGLFDVPLSALKQDAFILIRAANNDFGEGNTAAGLAKCQVIVSVGRHLGQQPGAYPLISGIALEAIGIHRLAEFIVTGPATDRDLDALVLVCDDLDSHWQSISRDISRARHMFCHLLGDKRSLGIRIAEWFMRICDRNAAWGRNHVNELYHRLLCERRAHRILIELRHYKNKTGRWPDSLDAIKYSLPAEALIDPQNGCPYVYQTMEDGFRLYSIGPNGRDENGRHKSDGPDDRPIWPPWRREETP
mgnify:CR=1 FL=1